MGGEVKKLQGYNVKTRIVEIGPHSSVFRPLFQTTLQLIRENDVSAKTRDLMINMEVLHE